MWSENSPLKWRKWLVTFLWLSTFLSTIASFIKIYHKLSITFYNLNMICYRGLCVIFVLCWVINSQMLYDIPWTAVTEEALFITYFLRWTRMLFFKRKNIHIMIKMFHLTCVQLPTEFHMDSSQTFFCVYQHDVNMQYWMM